MSKSAHLPIGILATCILVALASRGCTPVSGYEENIDEPILGYVVQFSVPDTTVQSRIPVRISGTVGGSAAFHFDRINIVHTDTLFEIGVWGRQVQKQGVHYTPGDVNFDTTLILTSALKGIHFIEVIAANGIFVDTTMVL